MAQEFDLIDVSKLPVAPTIEGLTVIGVDVTGKSVRATMLQLKGNKGDSPTIGANGNWWISGVDTGQTAQSVPNTKVIYNLTQIAGVTYADKTAARNAVPANLRGLDQIIVYRIASGSIVEQFKGTDVSGWATESNWKIVGEVTLADLALKADKKLADNSPVTYFKNGVAGTGDLTTQLRANIKGGQLYTNNWFNEPISAASMMPQPTTTPGDTSGFAFTTIRLDPNTWYEIGGLANALAKLTNLPVSVNDRGTVLKAEWRNTGTPTTITTGTGNMPPSAALFSGTTAPALMQEFIWASYNSTIRFKTNDTNLWLGMNVKLTDKYQIYVQAEGGQRIYPEAAFDSRTTVTLKVVGSSGGGGGSLTDSSGNTLASLDFASTITAALSNIHGISSDSGTPIRKNILPPYAELQKIGDYWIVTSGVIEHAAVPFAGSGYIMNFIPVKPNTRYAYNLPLRLAPSPLVSRQINYYSTNDSTAIIDPVEAYGWASGSFITPPNCHYIRVNCWFSGTNAPTNTWFIHEAYPEDTSGDLAVNIASSDLTDSEPYDNGVYLPNVFISSANIIDDGGGTPSGDYNINMRNNNTFVGSFNQSLDRVFAAKPRARHVFISHFTYDGGQGNGHNRRLIATQEAMCRNRNIPFINLADIMGLTFNDANIIAGVDYNNLKKFTSDGLHPGITDGSQDLANALTYRVTEALRPLFGTFWTGKIVANIGDSISAGYSFNSTTVGWAKFIERAITALGGVPKVYASTGGTLRRSTTDNRLIENSFLNESLTAWNIKTHVLDKIGTADEPALYIWELGVNDFEADATDFKLRW
ncbi:hypothetical protein G7050_02660 [Dysgonomonas sp. HDW5A]|uniref:hypothetical protein n=1 Tax=Dysgonomonas sp. HDW5A TaxID=2714926 RepID=UPI00140E0D71|nr:hypothetical protein [Dysgonomonas sp. HDW5A]QIK58801.1 hypothetical protein G7050_02660 [Dysgonomonas sp. HDW5A]